MRRVVALVMAGGRGERMAASGIRTPKPLVTVRGVPMLEHNVRLLLHWGLREVVVSASADDDRVAGFCRSRLAPLVEAAGGDLEVLVEPEPLGNVGCAGLLADRAGDVLVVFSDNLTVLDLRDVLELHRAQGADLTLACHEHGLRIPYGRLETDGDRVTGYVEKPTLPVLVSSAVSVLAPRALAALPPHEPSGLVDLTTRLLAENATVAAYRHQADWVDVNDAGRLADAEALVARHDRLFPWTGGERLP